MKSYFFTQWYKFIFKEVSGQFPNKDLTAPLWRRAIPARWWASIFPLPIFLSQKKKKKNGLDIYILKVDVTNPFLGNDTLDTPHYQWAGDRHPPSLQGPTLYRSIRDNIVCIGCSAAITVVKGFDNPVSMLVMYWRRLWFVVAEFC